jgi:hypothetical protein
MVTCITGRIKIISFVILISFVTTVVLDCTVYRNYCFSSDLHTPTANLTTFQKGLFYFGIKVFNHLPTSIKKTSHDIN